MLISGEPGIGKSRLVAALQERLGAEPRINLGYFCSPSGRDSALLPIAAQLQKAAGFEDDDTPERKLSKLVDLLAQTSTSDEDILADLLSISASDRYPQRDLAPQRRRDMTFEALLRQLERLAQRQPVLMLFEDVHWIDPTSHEFLDLALDRVAHLPMLLLVTFRPEFHPPWLGRSQVTMVVLNRPGRREGTALVDGVVGDRSLPETLVDEIVERCDGVPLLWRR